MLEVAAIVVPVAVSILGGGLAMAWRLGGLEATVKSLVERFDRLTEDLEQLERARWSSTRSR